MAGKLELAKDSCIKALISSANRAPSRPWLSMVEVNEELVRIGLSPVKVTLQPLALAILETNGVVDRALFYRGVNLSPDEYNSYIGPYKTANIDTGPFPSEAFAEPDKAYTHMKVRYGLADSEDGLYVNELINVPYSIIGNTALTSVRI